MRLAMCTVTWKCMARKERQFKILNLLTPILDLMKELPEEMVTLLPRYFNGGSCDERTV
jgi:hypothetical protein